MSWRFFSVLMHMRAKQLGKERVVRCNLDGGSIIFASASLKAVSVDFLPLISYNQRLLCWPGTAVLDCFLREETSGRTSVHEKAVA